MNTAAWNAEAAALPAAGAAAPWWRPPTARRAVAVTTEGSTLAFRALVAFTSILLLSPQIYFPFLGKMRIALLAAGLAIAAHVLDRTIHQRSVTPMSTEIGVALALVFWAILTVPLSYWPGGSIEVLTETYLKAVAFFWLLGTVITSTDRLRTLAWTLVLCSIPLAATGLLNYVSGNLMSTGVPGLRRVVGYKGGSGIVGNPNDLALMLNLIIPITGAIILGARSAAAKCVASTALLLSAATVIVSFSRAGFLTLITTFVIFIGVLARRKSPGAAAALMFAALIVPPFLPEGYVDRLSTITNMEQDRTGSAQGRFADFALAGTIVAKNPVIGVGLGQDILAMREQRGEKGWTSVHNVYLQYAVDLGIPGFLLFVWLHVACFRSARTIEKRATGKREMSDLMHIAQGVQISLIAFTVAAFFHPIAYQFYFFSIGGLAVALKSAYRTEIGNARLQPDHA